MMNLSEIVKNLDVKRELEKERRDRGFLPDSLVDRLVICSMISDKDVVQIWLEFVSHIRIQWGVEDWTLEDNDVLEDWFESYAV